MEEAVHVIKGRRTQPRANFSGRYFKIQDAILEPKPLQKPHPPILIGGSGEQLTLRAVARHADACNLFGNPQEMARKLDVLRRHCDNEKRDFDEIERTCLPTFLLARDEASLKAKTERMGAPGTSRGFALTTAQAADLLAEYANVGVQLSICSIYKNDEETLELLAELIPQFA
jgi:alkanesulfonate monooxygenase SsuD/methylene tetrahydromethanopterin reductase-like flavin-dependent oxidoreductase (luciferase family)